MTAPNIHEVLDLMQNEYGDVKTFEHTRADFVRDWFKRENAKPLSKAGEGDITFCNMDGDKAWRAIWESKATYIVCNWALDNEPGFFDWKDQPNKMLIFVKNPRLWYLRMLKHFDMTFAPREEYFSFSRQKNDIHGTVKFRGEVWMGNDNTIDPYVVIGLDGFGFERNEKGIFEKFPHLGGVMIGSEVEIGVSTAIDRATLPGEYTVIEDWCKIDNLVHIAHNARIDKRTLVVSQSNIGGSARIGKQCWVGMSVVINSGVNVGNRCILGNHANVTKDIPDNSVVIKDNEIIGNVDEKEKWKRMVGPQLVPIVEEIKL